MMSKIHAVPGTSQEFLDAKLLSPRRKTSIANDNDGLVDEQLAHFGIARDSDYGRTLAEFAGNLYRAQASATALWRITTETLDSLPREDRISYFNAKKFLSFQVAKILDTLQNPARSTYQSLQSTQSTRYAKGNYPLFDNVTAIFSATPVIVRTATYIFACTEWVDDAFHGREPTHQIYSRLLNPTSIALANAIVDLEAGQHAADYLAWNYNSGMAAIDGLLANVVSRDDIIVVTRNLYGGVHQLLNDFYARPEKLNVALEWFDGYDAASFRVLLDATIEKYAERIGAGARIHVYIESPCNPHGYLVDVPAICAQSHRRECLVMLDSTLATPALHRPLQRANPTERPDYVVHSYTKDLSGHGTTTAGVVIAETWRMFMPKGDSIPGMSWEKTMFWDVYYVKGAFLDADKAFDVMTGMKTLEQRMLEKCLNTLVFTRFLDSHPLISVNSHALEHAENAKLRRKLMYLALPVPLFTLDMELAQLPQDAFTRFFDGLEPAFQHMVSIGQCNTMALCPALTSHSELDAEALGAAHIYPTTIRISMGNENVKELVAHFLLAARHFLDPVVPGFSNQFMAADEVDSTYARISRELFEAKLALSPKTINLLEERPKIVNRSG